MIRKINILKTLNNEESILARTEVDQLLDRYIESADTCHQIRDVAIWHLLTTFEDMCRFNFTGEIDNSLSDIAIFIDERKYALKHALDVIVRDTVATKVTLNQRNLDGCYEKSINLLEMGISYQRLYRALSTSFNNRASFSENLGGYEISISAASNPAYSALEVIGHGQLPIFDFMVLQYLILNKKVEQTEQIDQTSKAKYIEIRHDILVNSNARIKKRIVNYDYSNEYAYYLANQVHQRPTIIPEDFEFPWGKGFETQVLINSIIIRCLYHILVIDLLSQKNKIKGMHYESLVLKTTKPQLIEEISFLADNLDYKKIESFVDYLIFGNNVKNPDPALQPIFSTLTGELLIPCNLIITNDMQRNILSLFARVNKKGFDKQSHLFEDSMINEAAPLISQFPYTLTNQEFKKGKLKEEVDILIVDPNSHHILVLELRWFLQPGDAREVQQKVNVCSEKVKQAKRKVDFVKSNYQELLKRHFPDISDTEKWEVSGAVVIKGYGGQESQSSDIPIITLDILNHAAKQFSNLSCLYDWMCSKSWLPIEGLHFEQQIDKVEIDEVIISRPCIEIKTSPEELNQHIQASILTSK